MKDDFKDVVCDIFMNNYYNCLKINNKQQLLVSQHLQEESEYRQEGNYNSTQLLSLCDCGPKYCRCTEVFLEGDEEQI